MSVPLSEKTGFWRSPAVISSARVDSRFRCAASSVGFWRSASATACCNVSAAAGVACASAGRKPSSTRTQTPSRTIRECFMYISLKDRKQETARSIPGPQTLPATQSWAGPCPACLAAQNNRNSGSPRQRPNDWHLESEGTTYPARGRKVLHALCGLQPAAVRSQVHHTAAQSDRRR